MANGRVSWCFMSPGGLWKGFLVVSFQSVCQQLTSDVDKKFDIKARSHDPFLGIRFLVPKIGSRRENVGRLFVVCSHDPFFRTNKESSIWRQNDHAKFVGAFHLSRRVSDENRAGSISIRFFQNYGSVWWKVIFNVFTRSIFRNQQKSDPVNGPSNSLKFK